MFLFSAEMTIFAKTRHHSRGYTQNQQHEQVDTRSILLDTCVVCTSTTRHTHLPFRVFFCIIYSHLQLCTYSNKKHRFSIYTRVQIPPDISSWANLLCKQNYQASGWLWLQSPVFFSAVSSWERKLIDQWRGWGGHMMQSWVQGTYSWPAGLRYVKELTTMRGESRCCRNQQERKAEASYCVEHVLNILHG